MKKKIWFSKRDTLGNLTLTGYNSSMSNNTFIDKCNHEKGLRNSPYRFLNQIFSEVEEWNLRIYPSEKTSLLKKF